MVSRRIFLKDGGVAVLGLSMVPGFVYRAAMESRPKFAGNKILVTIFQRGGVDGLNVVVPFGEKAYYEHRPTIGIPAPSKDQPSALDLDGFFGLHPSMATFHSLYKSGELAIVQAAGSPHETRSHFEAQDFMESAAPGEKSVDDGWLNRYMQQNPTDKPNSFRGVAAGPVMPRSLKGSAPALSLGGMVAASEEMSQVAQMFGGMYEKEGSTLLGGTSHEMFEASKQLKELSAKPYQPTAGVVYPVNQPFAQNLRQLAQMIKANLGVEIAFVDVGGWDTHNGQETGAGNLPTKLQQFSNAISLFRRDLGDRMADVVILTMSEFGRTARENGNAGTDHGKANVMFVLGGGVKGGKVYGKWPGLAKEELNEDRDLKMTTDFRDVYSEVLVRHLGCRDPNKVFPGFAVDPARFRGVLG